MKTPDISEIFKKKRIGQLFMIGITGDTLTGEEEKFISKNNIGFIILFSRNTDNPDKVRALTQHIHKLGEIKPLIFIDQEGGPVVRFGEKTSTFISHMGLAATGKTEYAEFTGKIIGSEMNSMGIDGVFAPVLDVNTDKNNPVIGIRSFSDNKRKVTKFGTAFIKGLQKGGVIPCPKHFPGHGDTSEDSHYTLPSTEISPEDLFSTHIPPFKKAVKKGVKAIMTAHVRYSSIDNEPGTFSHYFLTSILRENLGFNGITFSDCLEMDAIKKNYSPSEIILKGINAGIDVFSVSHSLDFASQLIKILQKSLEEKPEIMQKIYSSAKRIKSAKQIHNRISVENNKSLRMHLNTERKIALRSITLVRNRKSTVPLDISKKLLVINMKKLSRSTDFSTQKDTISFESIVGRRFPNFEILNIKDESFEQKDLKKKIISAENIILINYSSKEDLDRNEKKFIENLFNLKKDMVFVAAENPFVLKKFPSASSMIATYGSRMVQVEALFSVLSGNGKPKGKLPVKIL